MLVPALPEFVTEGESKEEALAKTEGVVGAMLEYRQEHGLAVPSDIYPEFRRVTVVA